MGWKKKERETKKKLLDVNWQRYFMPTRVREFKMHLLVYTLARRNVLLVLLLLNIAPYT